jgi:hypothetical protein
MPGSLKARRLGCQKARAPADKNTNFQHNRHQLGATCHRTLVFWILQEYS